MIRDNTKKAAFAAALVLSALFAVRGADLPTREITSNNIYGFAGHGDTLWMVTDQGVNYTIATADTLTWLGYRAPLRILTLGFGGATAVICLDTTAYKKTGKLWFYSHTAHTYDSIDLPFRLDSLKKNIRDSVAFMGVSVTYVAGFFWIACLDGGLVRWDPSGRLMRTFFPMGNKSFDPATVRLDSTNGFSVFPDSAKRVTMVGASKTPPDSQALFVMTPAALYRFLPKDTLWNTIPSRFSDKALSFVKYVDIFSSDHSPLLFASIITKSGADVPDTSLYRFNPADSSWAKYTYSKNISALTFGPDSVVYLTIKPRRIQGFSGNTIDPHFRSEAFFSARITAAMANETPDTITDILYLPDSDTSGSFWIGAMSEGVIRNGLFFSRHEPKDERDSFPFIYVHREKKIEGGLKETYAYPGIIGQDSFDPSRQIRAVFAYSLSKASKVSISVYDWNMDLVKNVIFNEDRKAGKDDPLGNGRSNDRTRDFWDGTNNAGKRVAVGVYYFRITAQSGERSFGKIIVAK